MASAFCPHNCQHVCRHLAQCHPTERHALKSHSLIPECGEDNGPNDQCCLPHSPLRTNHFLHHLVTTACYDSFKNDPSLFSMMKCNFLNCQHFMARHQNLSLSGENSSVNINFLESTVESLLPSPGCFYKSPGILKPSLTLPCVLFGDMEFEGQTSSPSC